MPRDRAIRVPLALLASAVALLGTATPGVAAREPSPWATVNVCDTAGHPDGIGVRAWMPGTGDRRDELFMRLQLQFLRRSDDTWQTLGGSGDSGFVDVGNGLARGRQTGRTFTLSPPARGPARVRPARCGHVRVAPRRRGGPARAPRDDRRPRGHAGRRARGLLGADLLDTVTA